MPKFTETENQFWTMMLRWANGDDFLTCNICHMALVAGTDESHDHFFGKTHKDNNIYELFSDVEIHDYELVPDPVTGVPLPKEIKK